MSNLVPGVSEPRQLSATGNSPIVPEACAASYSSVGRSISRLKYTLLMGVTPSVQPHPLETAKGRGARKITQRARLCGIVPDPILALGGQGGLRQREIRLIFSGAQVAALFCRQFAQVNEAKQWPPSKLNETESKVGGLRLDLREQELN